MSVRFQMPSLKNWENSRIPSAFNSSNMPTLAKEQQKKDKEAVAAKGLIPGMAATNKGQTSIMAYTTQGALDKSTLLRPVNQTLPIKKAWVTGTALDKVTKMKSWKRRDQKVAMEMKKIRRLGQPAGGTQFP